MSKRWDHWLGKSGSGDSLDLVELVMELEEEFEITIPDEDVARIHSIADAMRYLEEHRRKGGTS